MFSINQFESAISNIDGVLGQMLMNSHGVVTSFTHKKGKSEKRENLYLSIANLITFLPEDEGQVDIRLDDTKFLCLRWRYHIFVIELAKGHPVNKSIQRTVRRLQRNYDKPAVQSVRWNGNDAQPAASSSDPKMGGSSPSLEVVPSMTGASQEDQSSQENLSQSQQSENSGRRPGSDSKPDLS